MDTNGLVLKVLVHAANIADTQGGQDLLATLEVDEFPRLRHVWADGGYFHAFSEAAHARGLTVQVVKRARKRTGVLDELARTVMTPDEYDRVYGDGFRVLPRRWVVERTFSWFARYRRLTRDYEGLTRVSQAMIYLAMISLMLNRLSRRSAL